MKMLTIHSVLYFCIWICICMATTRWNGRDAYKWLVSSLNFLHRTRELVQCYGPDYPWANNPFALACNISARPQTPRSGMLWTKINGKDVQQPSKTEMEKRDAEQKRLKQWLNVMYVRLPMLFPHATSTCPTTTQTNAHANASMRTPVLGVHRQCQCQFQC